METKFVMYLVYLAVSVALTIWVGRTLFRNGRVFLEDALGDERLAGSVNHLLVVGFYLLNLGYVSVALKVTGQVGTASDAMESLSVKVGLVLLVLGVVHFFNLFVLSRFRHRQRRHTNPQPVSPIGMLPVAAPVHAPAPPPPAHRPPPVMGWQEPDVDP